MVGFFTTEDKEGPLQLGRNEKFYDEEHKEWFQHNRLSDVSSMQQESKAGRV